MAQRALLVGVADYALFEPLPGCAADVNALLPLLSSNQDGRPNFDCKVLLGSVEDTSEVTRALLEQRLTELLAPGADVALLYFSGHGALVVDELVLVTSDGTIEAPGVRMTEVFAKINASPVREVVVMLDCCFAGKAAGSARLEQELSVLREGVSILAASRADERAAEMAGQGLFSGHLRAALEGQAADKLGRVDLASVYQYVSRACSSWQQRPIFKLNVQRLLVLRECQPEPVVWWKKRAALLAVTPLVAGLLSAGMLWPPNTEAFAQETQDLEHSCTAEQSPCEFSVRTQCPWGSRALGACQPQHKVFGKRGRCRAQAQSVDGRETAVQLTILAELRAPVRCKVDACKCEYMSLWQLIAGGFAQ